MTIRIECDTLIEVIKEEILLENRLGLIHVLTCISALIMAGLMFISPLRIFASVGLWLSMAGFMLHGARIQLEEWIPITFSTKLQDFIVTLTFGIFNGLGLLRMLGSSSLYFFIAGWIILVSHLIYFVLKAEIIYVQNLKQN